MSKQDTLLREYVRSILAERTTGGGVELGDYGDELGDVFLKPFKDAANVIKGEISKLSSRAQSVVSKLAIGLAAMLTPFLEANFDEIKRREQAEIREIESDPEIREAWQAVKPHATSGFRKMFFLFDPVGYITTDLAVKKPELAIEAAGLLTGREAMAAISVVGKRMYQQYQDTKLSGRKRLEWKKLISHIESLTEARRLDEQIIDPAVVKMLFENPEVKKILENSDAAEHVREKSAEIAQETAEELMRMIGKVLSANTIEEIEQLTGKTVDTSIVQRLSGEEVATQQAALAQAKTEFKQDVVREVGDLIESRGLAEQKEHPYHKALLKVLESLV